MSGAMGGSASEEFLAPCASGEDTYVRCPPRATPPTSRPSPRPRPRQRRPEDSRRRRSCTTPRTRRPSRRWSRTSTGSACGGRGRGTAADTLKNVMVKTRLPGGDGVDAARRRRPRRPRGRHEAPRGVAVARPRSRCSRTRTSPRTRFLTKGYIGPVGLAKQRRALPRRPPDRRPAPPGSPAPTSPGATSSTSSPAATSPPTARSRPPRCARATPRPTAAVRWCAARGIEIGPHLPARPQVRRRARAVDVQGADGKPTTITMGSYGVGVTRAVAAITEQHADDKGLVWPAEVAPYAVHLVDRRQGPGPGRGGRPDRDASSPTRASRCCSTTARPRRA